MQGLLKKAQNIELKVKQLKTRLEMLDKENAYYKEENKNLVEKLKQQKGVINELESTINNKANKPEQVENAQKAEIKSKIDAHVREIDQVIDLLRT
jgi:predicted  nucleic acid-binding Zn-ribbon protein